MRENGYYWVLWGGDWCVLEWDGVWNAPDRYEFNDDEFEEIDERRIVRGESMKYKNCIARLQEIAATNNIDWIFGHNGDCVEVGFYVDLGSAIAECKRTILVTDLNHSHNPDSILYDAVDWCEGEIMKGFISVKGEQ